jgi:hypothetical protein
VTDHPNARRLDGLAAGGDDLDANAHLSRCAACANYVEALRRTSPPWSAREAEAFVARAERSFAPPGGPAGRPFEPTSPAHRSDRGRAFAAQTRRLALVATPLLAAAAALLIALRPGPPPAQAPGAPPAQAPGAASVSDAGSVHFKGELALAIVRERDGAQERLVHAADVRAGDRVRLEVSSPQAGPLLAGVLADDGAWLTLIDDASAGVGTHFSERAARFDAEPTEGFVLAGRPDDVERAKSTRRFEGVASLRLRYDRGP